MRKIIFLFTLVIAQTSFGKMYDISLSKKYDYLNKILPYVIESHLQLVPSEYEIEQNWREKFNQWVTDWHMPGHEDIERVFFYTEDKSGRRFRSNIFLRVRNRNYLNFEYNGTARVIYEDQGTVPLYVDLTDRWFVGFQNDFQSLAIKYDYIGDFQPKDQELTDAKIDLVIQELAYVKDQIFHRMRVFELLDDTDGLTGKVKKVAVFYTDDYFMKKYIGYQRSMAKIAEELDYSIDAQNDDLVGSLSQKREQVMQAIWAVHKKYNEIINEIKTSFTGRHAFASRLNEEQFLYAIEIMDNYKESLLRLKRQLMNSLQEDLGFPYEPGQRREL
jgi:hypothetical protein